MSELSNTLSVVLNRTYGALSTEDINDQETYYQDDNHAYVTNRRKKPGVPRYTLEVRPSGIRGANNGQLNMKQQSQKTAGEVHVY
jgi:hypothetical protein